MNEHWQFKSRLNIFAWPEKEGDNMEIAYAGDSSDFLLSIKVSYIRLVHFMY